MLTTFYRALLSLAAWAGLLAVSASISAQAVLPLADEPVDQQRYLAHIQVHSASELAEILGRADDLFQRNSGEIAEPIVFVLHGSEARAFLRKNYGRYRSMVDVAARLSAFGVVDVRVCERWMGGQHIEPAELMPFVTTVPYGPAEVRRLISQEDYLYF